MIQARLQRLLHQRFPRGYGLHQHPLGPPRNVGRFGYDLRRALRHGPPQLRAGLLIPALGFFGERSQPVYLRFEFLPRFNLCAHAFASIRLCVCDSRWLSGVPGREPPPPRKAPRPVRPAAPSGGPPPAQWRLPLPGVPGPQRPCGRRARRGRPRRRTRVPSRPRPDGSSCSSVLPAPASPKPWQLRNRGLGERVTQHGWLAPLRGRLFHSAPPIFRFFRFLRKPHLFLRLRFASSTNEGKQSSALTSTHSPLEGSCRAIQVGYSLHLTTRPRLPASSSLRLLREADSSRLVSGETFVDTLFARFK